jgi:hypothetical protein
LYGDNEMCGQPECDCCRYAHKRIAELEAALRGIVNHWNEFGCAMIEHKDDYGLSERVEAAENLLGR